MNEKIYTVKEVAELLKVHWQTVLNYIKKGKIKAVKIGKNYRVTELDLKSFISENKTT